MNIDEVIDELVLEIARLKRDLVLEKAKVTALKKHIEDNAKVTE